MGRVKSIRGSLASLGDWWEGDLTDTPLVGFPSKIAENREDGIGKKGCGGPTLGNNNSGDLKWGPKTNSWEKKFGGQRLTGKQGAKTGQRLHDTLRKKE